MSLEIGRRQAVVIGFGALLVGAHQILSQPDSDEAQAIQACKNSQADSNFAQQNPGKVLSDLVVTERVNVRSAPNTDSFKEGQLNAGETIVEAYPTRYDPNNKTEWVGFDPDGNCGHMKYVAEEYTRRGILSSWLPK